MYEHFVTGGVVELVNAVLVRLNPECVTALPFADAAGTLVSSVSTVVTVTAYVTATLIGHFS
jgi:hypothetical protein